MKFISGPTNQQYETYWMKDPTQITFILLSSYDYSWIG